MKKILMIMSMLILAMTMSPLAPVMAEITLSAHMTGDQETPPVDTEGVGDATLVIDDDLTQISFSFDFTGVENATAAHIHIGEPGVGGPIIFPDASTPSFDLNKRQGVLTADDHRPAPGAETFEDAVNAILNGQTYFNVHSQQHPGGEIRGQILQDAKGSVSRLNTQMLGRLDWAHLRYDPVMELAKSGAIQITCVH